MEQDKKRDRRLRIQYYDRVEIMEPMTEEEAIGAHKALSTLMNMGMEDLYVHEINILELDKINKQIKELEKRRQELLYGRN